MGEDGTCEAKADLRILAEPIQRGLIGHLIAVSQDLASPPEPYSSMLPLCHHPHKQHYAIYVVTGDEVIAVAFGAERDGHDPFHIADVRWRKRQRITI